ncbi:hypothetical protein CI102_12836 [Trichoderma harzianum]|nr:hypothetical protein CI102_12836 [Trichoderma harzianum]
MALMAPTTKQKFDNQWMRLTLFLSAISVRNTFVCCMSQSSNHSLASRIDDRWDVAILPSNSTRPTQQRLWRIHGESSSAALPSGWGRWNHVVSIQRSQFEACCADQREPCNPIQSLLIMFRDMHPFLEYRTSSLQEMPQVVQHGSYP